MAIQTLKIGSAVTVKDNGTHGVITEINEGRYRVGRSKLWYSAGDLRGDKVTPAKKPKQPIKRISGTTKILLAIYQILRFEYLMHNKLCRANFPGCKGGAKEIHHMYLRTGFWLIISKYFLPICRPCHRYATKNSKEAIQKGVSISRNSDLEYEFCEFERELIKKHGISPP